MPFRRREDNVRDGRVSDGSNCILCWWSVVDRCLLLVGGGEKEGREEEGQVVQFWLVVVRRSWVGGGGSGEGGLEGIFGRGVCRCLWRGTVETGWMGVRDRSTESVLFRPMSSAMDGGSNSLPSRSILHFVESTIPNIFITKSKTC